MTETAFPFRRDCSLLRLLLFLGTAAGAAPSAEQPQRATPAEGTAAPAEEARLSASQFREGLQARGLTELLELHLKDFPPSNAMASLLLMDKVKRAEFADRTRPLSQRQEAVAQANWILEELIEKGTGDPRRFEWQFALAHSLIYDEGEPFATSILYRGGGRSDRQRLLQLTTRALATVAALVAQLAAEYDRLDTLSLAEFERLERNNYIESLDRLTPQADYLLPWALFFDSLPRSEADPVRAAQLNRIVGLLTARPALLKPSPESSRVQVETLLLAGMTYRLLNDHAAAADHLERAMTAAGRLTDATEKHRADWAVLLASIERIRNARGDGRFDAAMAGLKDFREAPREPQAQVGLAVIAALLERSIHEARATSAERDGRVVEAARFRDEAWQAVARLARTGPEYRNEVYAALYGLVGADADSEGLDPLEQCALIVGLLTDAGQGGADSDRLLTKVVAVGERFLSSQTGAAIALTPEVLYHIGVAQHRRGRSAEAAGRFLEIAEKHQAYEDAPQAAAFAVQLAAELYGDSAGRGDPAIVQLYRRSLEALVSGFADTEAARYWRFYYSQLLDELGEYDRAATQYAFVDGEHEHYLESLYLRVRSAALGLHRYAADRPGDELGLRRRASDFLTLERDFVGRATGAVGRSADPQRARSLEGMLAQVRLLAAEVQILPQIDQAAQALDGISEFEKEYAGHADLFPRLWRVRLVAYARLGLIDEAGRAISAYMATEPLRTVETLQSLYLELSPETPSSGDGRAAAGKAEVALLLAEQIHRWATRPESTLPSLDRWAVTVQWAEANLHAGRHEQARSIYESCRSSEGLPSAAADDPRLTLGYAESLFQLREYAAALTLFNRLATGLPAGDASRWKALLRDLQCRTALGHPAADIVKVIQQQRFLHPDLGGPILAPQFEQLQRENERRVTGK